MCSNVSMISYLVIINWFAWRHIGQNWAAIIRDYWLLNDSYKYIPYCCVPSQASVWIGGLWACWCSRWWLGGLHLTLLPTILTWTQRNTSFKVRQRKRTTLFLSFNDIEHRKICRRFETLCTYGRSASVAACSELFVKVRRCRSIL